MGIMDRVRGWLQSAEPSAKRSAPTFESYLETAGEKLREFQVAISRMESELLSLKERARGLERQAAGFRVQAEQAAVLTDTEGARTGLEREFDSIRQSEALHRTVRSMEERLLQMKARYDQFKQAVAEATEKHDMLSMRTLAASTEWEASRATAGNGHEVELQRRTQAALEAEALSELRQQNGRNHIDEEIAKLLRERKPH